MPSRKRKVQLRYNAYYKNRGPNSACIFCDSSETKIIGGSENFHVVQNLFPYDIWDAQGVLDHIMLVPKRHTDSISDFTKEEMQEFGELLQVYDKKGYDIAARNSGSSAKSIAHQHTHLIKLDHQHRRYLLFLRKPFIMWSK